MEWIVFASQMLTCYFFWHTTIQVIFNFDIHPASGIVAMAILVILFMVC
jgi:hypothetical protein